jgi:hypothetical protein
MEPGNAAMAGSILGMVAGGMQNQNQMNQQGQLMNLQLRNQKELNKQGSELSYQNWLRTNYSAQRDQMEKAGLNVGMMYGMGGAGGTLTGGSGGSAAGGQAPQPNNQMAMLLGDLAANIDLKKAQARNLNVDSDKKEGVDTDLTKTQIDMNKLTNLFNSGNMETALSTSKQELDNKIAENKILVESGKLTESNAKIADEKNRAEVNNIIADTLLKESGVDRNNAEIKKWATELIQNAQRIAIESRNASTNEKNAKINEFRAETERLFPSIQQVMGGQAQKVQNLSENLLKKGLELIGVKYDDWFKSK